MTQALNRISFSLTAALLLFAGLPLQADIYYVSIDRSHFSPATTTINVGDTVIWVNQDVNDDSHSTVSTLPFGNANYWNGLLVNVDDEFSHTFDQTGTFTYYDQFDTGTGTIIVQIPVVTPVITLETPRLVAGQLQFEATGLTAGKTQVLFSSTNLTSWTAIQTNVAASSSQTFTNPANLGQCFFQLVEQP